MKIKSKRFWTFFDHELEDEHYDDVLLVPYIKYLQKLYEEIINPDLKNKIEKDMAELWKMAYPCQYIIPIIEELEKIIYKEM